jgi:hypothetical protein
VKRFLPLMLIPLLGISAFMAPRSALAETKTGQPTMDLCVQAKRLIDKVATVILNQPAAEAFDVVIKDVLGEICALRKASEANPELTPAVDNLVVAVIGWAWDVSTLIKFKAERNAAAADIAAKGVKRRVTTIQVLCPALVIPDVANIP